MQDLNLTLIQSDIHWQDVGANLAMFEEKIWQIEGETDIIVLPEMFNTGFSMETRLAEPMNLTTFKWMKQMAAQTGAVITGSYMVKEEGKVFNRLVWMQPDGSYQKYDKHHLFRMADEHNHFNFGMERVIIEWKGWKICPLVCYDLRFPVWSRNQGLEYDVLMYVANWPAVRISAWDSLLKARAIENVAYCVGLNRLGKDKNDIEYNGHTSAFGPKGDSMAFSEKEEMISVILNADELKNFRKKFPAHLDADDFEVK